MKEIRETIFWCQAAVSIESWKGGTFGNVTFRDISISYEGNKNPELKNLQVSQPPADSRLLPCWGWYARNVQNMVLENVELNYRGEDVRPAFWLNNVGKTELIQVNYTGLERVPMDGTRQSMPSILLYEFRPNCCM